MRDWHRVELLNACSTLVSEGLMDFAGLRAAITAYDERKELQETLDLVVKHERDEHRVSLEEAYSSVMTGTPLPADELEHQES